MAYLNSIAGALTTVSAPTPSHALGTVASGSEGSQWIYAQASTTLSANLAVGIDEAFKANPLTSTFAAAGSVIAWPQHAVPISEYFWACMQGRGTINIAVASSCAADVALYTTGTAGVLDDSATATQSLVEGVVIVTTQLSTTGLTGTPAIVTFPRSK